MSVSREQLKKIANELFDKIDANGNGALSKDEVRAFSQQIIGQFKPDNEHNEDKFEENFAKLDKDGNGHVDREELLKSIVAKAEEHGVLAD